MAKGKEAKPKSKEEQVNEMLTLFSGVSFLATVASGGVSVGGGLIENETMGNVGNVGVAVFGIVFLLCTAMLGGARFLPRGKRRQAKAA